MSLVSVTESLLLQVGGYHASPHVRAAVGLGPGGHVQVIRSDMAGPWDSGHMQFVILLDIEVGNGQLNIQNESSGVRSGIGGGNTGVIYMSTVFRAVNLMRSLRRLEKRTVGTVWHVPIFQVCHVRRDLGGRPRRMANKAAGDLRKKMCHRRQGKILLRNT